MEDILKLLSQYPIKTRLNLRGTLIVARDIAHAKIKEILIIVNKGQLNQFKKLSNEQLNSIENIKNGMELIKRAIGNITLSKTPFL